MEELDSFFVDVENVISVNDYESDSEIDELFCEVDLLFVKWWWCWKKWNLLKVNESIGEVVLFFEVEIIVFFVEIEVGEKIVEVEIMEFEEKFFDKVSENKIVELNLNIEEIFLKEIVLFIFVVSELDIIFCNVGCSSSVKIDVFEILLFEKFLVIERDN